MLDSDLKSKINQLWDKFWSSGISNPLQAIEQMSYLMFMKRLDDDEISKEKNVQLSKEPFESIFKDCPKARWSYWHNKSSDKMLVHVRDKVFPFLRDLGDDNSFYSRYMKDAVFAIPTGTLLTEATSIIDGMHFKEQNLDPIGDIYEYLVSELKS
ncbi:MAG: type I restriction-modification system subunit M N-terminal domain-containing protein, partial [Methanobacteriaceae archaeon]|nr:type I restriction-modification system subunit M N-terminal domain-containing protein [Methanobacteriaceae archaeon]